MYRQLWSEGRQLKPSVMRLYTHGEVIALIDTRTIATCSFADRRRNPHELSAKLASHSRGAARARSATSSNDP